MRRATIAFLVASLVLPSVVSAQTERGVVVDPESPSGKEYAIPLDQARREAAGNADSDLGARASGAGRLFGVGIARRSRGSRANDGSSQVREGENDAARSPTGPSGDGISRGGRAKPSVAPAAASTGGGGSQTVKTGLLALGVLAAGGGIGLLLRRMLA